MQTHIYRHTHAHTLPRLTQAVLPRPDIIYGVTNSHCATNPWRATILRHSKRIHLGHFATAEAAAFAYDEALLATGDSRRVDRWRNFPSIEAAAAAVARSQLQLQLHVCDDDGTDMHAAVAPELCAHASDEQVICWSSH